MTKPLRKTLIIVGVLIVVVIIMAVIYGVFFSTKIPVSTPDGTSFPIASTSPGATSGATTITIAGKDGKALMVNNFVTASGTVPEPYTKGEYILADDCAGTDGCTSAAAASGFRVVYDSRDQTFNVLILSEPLKDSRKNAAQFLMQSLGVSQAGLCSLNATVGTILSVNAAYAGESLGFSGCPGAIVLP